MRHVLALILCLAALPLPAAPQAYAIDRADSKVEIVLLAIGARVRASVPVVAGDFALDFEDISRSRIDVRVDATAIAAGVSFVTDTLRGPEGLDAARHPEVRLVATDIRLNVPGDFTRGARIAGDLTVRGVTRPVVLDAMLLRQAGSDPADLSRLLVAVTGMVDRRDFGLTAYPVAVAPEILLEIEARLTRR